MTSGERGTGPVAYLEVWRPSAVERVALKGERLTIGRDATNDVALAHDREVSRVHAVLEQLASRWCLRDLESSNGTWVGGVQVLGERVLRTDDEIRVGSTRMFLRMHESSTERDDVTLKAERAPELTRREHEVLVSLCRSMLSAASFREPASIRQMASGLSVTEAAIKQHLLRLYDKFHIEEGEERRRVRLANEAIRRGAVTVAELQASRTPPGR